jgi:alpha-L-fucosidase
MVFCEEIRESQRIEGFYIMAEMCEGWKIIYSGTTVGFKKICRFAPARAKNWRINITQSRKAPTVRFVAGYVD